MDDVSRAEVDIEADPRAQCYRDLHTAVYMFEASATMTSAPIKAFKEAKVKALIRRVRGRNLLTETACVLERGRTLKLWTQQMSWANT